MNLTEEAFYYSMSSGHFFQNQAVIFRLDGCAGGKECTIIGEPSHADHPGSIRVNLPTDDM
jgi:hypothetical protein